MEQIHLTCIRCPRGCQLEVAVEDGAVVSVAGNACKRGEVYGKAEVTAPVRVVTSTVRVLQDGRVPSRDRAVRCPVKTSDAIPKGLIFDAVKAIEAASIKPPVRIGDVIIPHICGTQADLVATKNII